MNNLRYSYFKELAGLRELVSRKKKLEEGFEYIEVRYFNPVEGVDKRLEQMINDHIEQITDKWVTI